MTRSISVAAPSGIVWPWIAQFGRGAGWYSYDIIDNGGRRSAEHLVSWIPEPALGDACAVGYVRSLELGRHIAWWMSGIGIPGVRLRNVMTFSLSEEEGGTRVVMRMTADARGPLARVTCWLYRILDTVMARRALLGIRDRAERHGARSEDLSRPETGARDQFQKFQSILWNDLVVGDPRRRDAQRWRREALEATPGSTAEAGVSEARDVRGNSSAT